MLSNDSEAEFVIRMFGPFEACLNGHPLPSLRSQKGRWLLALLALHQGQALPRLLLAQTLWPDRLQSEALTSLRQILADLRRAMGSAADRLLMVTPRTLGLSVKGVDVDVRRFDREIVKRENIREDADALRRAVALYRGPLLAECAEPWVIAEREQQGQWYLQALQRLAALAGAEGSDAEEVAYLRQAIATDPLRETLVGSLMRALVGQGDYGSAIQAYQTLRRRLSEELHAEPSPELQALYRQLQADAGRRARPDLPRLTPPASPPSVHVPRPLTPLIGREQQIQEVLARLSTSRMVALVGMGGAGKTRLAVHIALALAAEYVDGIWFVDFSSLTAPQLAVQQVALVLGVPEERGRMRIETLIDFLHARHLLLVLDNCEHLLPGCAELAAALLSSCPRLRILATSRQKLGLMGESLCQLAGLALPITASAPDTAPVINIEALLRSEAGRLFVDRARALRADLPLDGHSAQAIATLCTLLDGLPLAIELAAAQVETMTPQEIVTRLEAGLELPDDASPIRPQRHQTLEALLDSSFSLLTQAQQALLRRLAVFAGRWTLRDAEAVCALEAGEDLLPPLSRLVAKSLIAAEAREGKTWYRLLDVIRRNLERRLEQSGEMEALQQRHSDHYLALASEAERRLTGPEQTRWLERLDAALDNLRAALCTAEATAADDMTLLRLVNALGRFWQIRGYWGEGRSWIERALERADPAQSHDHEARALRANALNWAGILATYQGDLGQGQANSEQGLALWTSLGDTRGIAGSIGCLGIVAYYRGDYRGAQSYHTASLELARTNQDLSGMASALGYLGNLATALGNYAPAWLYYRESLALRRDLQDTWGVAASLNNLGLLAHHEQDWNAAIRYFEESLALRRQLGDRRCLAITLNLLGLCACEQGDADQSRAYLTEGLELCREIGDRRSIAYSLEAFASLAILEDDLQRAARLSGAAAALRASIPSPLPPSEQPAEKAKMQALQEALGGDAFAQHWQAGHSLTVDAAVSYVRA